MDDRPDDLGNGIWIAIALAVAFAVYLSWVL
jgi:hypothetical protein